MFKAGGERQYLYVGRTMLRAITNATNLGLSYPGGDRPIERILDFGSGFGRLTRFLRAAFPSAEITVTDLNPDAVEWCVSRYDCLSLNEPAPQNYFDLIWLGSVFTHLPEQATETWIARLTQWLRPAGILIFTSQGRFAIAQLEAALRNPDTPKHASYGLDTAAVRKVIEGYRSTGYGFIDYPKRSDYGVCCARPSWYSERVLSNGDYIQILLQEKGIDNHQDVSAFIRLPLMDTRKASFW